MRANIKHNKCHNLGSRASPRVRIWLKSSDQTEKAKTGRAQDRTDKAQKKAHTRPDRKSPDKAPDLAEIAQTRRTQD